MPRFFHPYFRYLSIFFWGGIVSCVACTTELTLGNSEPYIVSVGPLGIGESDTVDIFYTIADFQHDDADINVQICTSKKCYTAVSSPFGDGTRRIPTVGSAPNTYSASHLFSWELACGLLDTSSGTYETIPLDTEFWAQISVATSDTPPVESKRYTLKKLGFATVPKKACN